MKNYKDMADAVFRRRDEYVASVKRKKKIALNASLSLCSICLAVLGAFGIYKSGVLTPDPNVIGTKPPSYTEPTDETFHSLISNATSEGEHSEHTEHISGNSKPQNPSGSSNPTEDNKTKSTDPDENESKPQVKPTLPALPTLPIGPNRPTLPTLPTLPKPPSVHPEVPPTSGDNPKPKPPVVLPTDPIEVPGATSATSGSDNTDSEIPPVTDDSDIAWPDSPGWPGVPDEPATDVCTEPVETYTSPCWTEPWAPETQAPMEPTEPPIVLPTMPMAPTEPTIIPEETEAPTANISVYGKVIDQNGHPVAGAELTLYYSQSHYITVKSNSSGQFSFLNVHYQSGAYIRQTDAPSGYKPASNRIYVDTNDYGSIVFVCTKK